MPLLAPVMRTIGWVVGAVVGMGKGRDDAAEEEDLMASGPGGWCPADVRRR